MGIVNLDEFLARIGNPELEDFQEQHIEAIILPGVQKDLETYCNRPLELTMVYERLQPDIDGWIYFGVTPVHQIISIRNVNGDAIDYTRPNPPAITPPADPNMNVLDLTGGVGWVDTPYKVWVQRLNPAGLFFGQDPYLYTQYIGGIDCSSNEKVKDGIIEVAKRKAVAEFSIEVGVRVGSLEPTPDADNRPPMWTQEELEQFDRFRRRVVV